ncbi:hypothetical protein QVD17_05297 [Tagetes erecta]|uniref:PsbP C-terminal domain-containing protein n=1 Tax=Tagetes erecta TaxID=13708 RepID=A0AAD8LES5_TARER|nr:hypothetical protein QVD17_05297 [Tagetes erecta]
MLASSYGLCSIKTNPIPIQSSSSSIFNRSSSPCISNNLQPQNNNQPIQPTRRNLLNISIIIIASSIAPISPCNSETETEDVFDVERYTDLNEGFTLLKPKSWVKVEKAGATLLFEDPSKGSNNVGVVVTPVRLSSLGQFGDPQFVANKLIQAEKRKESTKDVELVSCRERPRESGDLQVYEFEYDLDSTRGGLKKIFSAAFVTSKKLYLLNIAHSQQPPLSNNKRMMLEKVLHSFDVSSTTNN